MKIKIKVTALYLLLVAFVFAGCGGCGGDGNSSSTYTVTFNSQGGSTVAAQTVNPGEYAVEPAAPTPGETYFTFAGWYKEAACINAWDFNVETVTGNVTLYAKWNDQYALRDTGPAGGLIFYLNPDYATDGWRYLEAAPSDQSTGVSWYNGSDILISATNDAIGTGQANTTAIVNSQGAGTYAAIICDDFVIGSYSDWFLPSQNELQQMYNNLKAAPYGVGGFFDELYWGSTEYTETEAGVLFFTSGNGGILAKSAARRVRAVRSF